MLNGPCRCVAADSRDLECFAAAHLPWCQQPRDVDERRAPTAAARWRRPHRLRYGTGSAIGIATTAQRPAAQQRSVQRRRRTSLAAQAAVKFRSPGVPKHLLFSVGSTVFDASQKAQCGYFSVIGGALALAATSKASAPLPSGAVTLVSLGAAALGVQMTVVWPVLKTRALALVAEKKPPPSAMHGWCVKHREGPLSQHPFRPCSALPFDQLSPLDPSTHLRRLSLTTAPAPDHSRPLAPQVSCARAREDPFSRRCGRAVDAASVGAWLGSRTSVVDARSLTVFGARQAAVLSTHGGSKESTMTINPRGGGCEHAK
jgi:hypothetical protein